MADAITGQRMSHSSCSRTAVNLSWRTALAALQRCLVTDEMAKRRCERHFAERQGGPRAHWRSESRIQCRGVIHPLLNAAQRALASQRHTRIDHRALMPSCHELISLHWYMTGLTAAVSWSNLATHRPSASFITSAFEAGSTRADTIQPSYRNKNTSLTGQSLLALPQRCL
jgi:hypothetical protein